MFLRIAGLLTFLVLAGCENVERAPEFTPLPANEVLAVSGAERSHLYHLGKKWPLKSMDPSRAERLAKILFPGMKVFYRADERRMAFDSTRSADAFVEVARWADGMILALRTMESATDRTSGDPAGTIFENLRRYLLVDDPSELPDWAAVSKALDDEDVWRTSPNIAGVGAIVFAGLILRGEASDPAKDRAAELLGRAIALREVPEWLSWTAQLNWTRRDLIASEERP
jgi:hypothetical protein